MLAFYNLLISQYIQRVFLTEVLLKAKINIRVRDINTYDRQLYFVIKDLKTLLELKLYFLLSFQAINNILLEI